MAKNSVTDWSETAGDNTDIANVNIDEGCAPSDINNAIRTMMAQLKAFFKSTVFRLWDGTDPTKKLALDLSGITTATTRTLTVPDESGTIALVTPPVATVCFRADKNGVDQTGVGNAPITFTHEVFDIGGYYDAANSRWTPPAGKVRLHTRVLIAGAVADQTSYVVSFTKNGTIVSSSVIRASGSNSMSVDLSEIVETNGTDYWGVNLNSGGASITASGPVEYTTFSGETL